MAPPQEEKVPGRRLISRVILAIMRRPVEAILSDVLSAPIVHGDRSRLHIHPRARVNDALFNTRSGTITIEENAFFGHDVMVLAGRHDFTKFGMERRDATPATGSDIVVRTGAWVASRAILVGPCEIGEHAVVAAGSIVTSSIPAYAIAAGAPARVIRMIEERPTE